MIDSILRYYRALPLFKGKLRLGKLIFKNLIHRQTAVEFTAHNYIKYKIPNTIESLGIELLINGIYEKDIINFLNHHIKPGDVYFDIGANIGSVGIPIVKSKANLKYYGFEASPVIFEYLQYNFKKNNLKTTDYQLHNNLVYEDNGNALKFYQGEYYGKSSLAPTYSQEYIFVDAISLDSFCEEQRVNKINWMKIDVQGFELSVLKGLEQHLVSKQVENILFEFEYWAEADAGLEIGAAQRYLLGVGYELFDIAGKKIDKVITKGSTMIWAKPKV